jgi:hypothetical protein
VDSEIPDSSNSNLIAGTAFAGIVIFSKRQGLSVLLSRQPNMHQHWLRGNFYRKYPITPYNTNKVEYSGSPLGESLSRDVFVPPARTRAIFPRS